jgi:Zn-dependent M28 family amino/carboxypeptidase
VRVAACVLVAACTPAHDLPDAPACAPPELGATWLHALVADSIAQLASAPRSTTTERDTARAYLADQLARMGWDPQLQSYPTGANVYAAIESTTGSAQRIVVGAHFDTVAGSPGANDNATGVAAALAVARYLRDTPCRGPTVIVAFFDEEELGLFGSRAFVPSLAGLDVTAVHTIDQIGWDGDGDRRFELELPTAALEQEYDAAAADLGVPVTRTTTQGTDHQAFRDAGYPAVGLTEEFVEGDTTPYRHTPQDTPATVDVDYAVLGAELVGDVVLREVAVE